MPGGAKPEKLRPSGGFQTDYRWKNWERGLLWVPFRIFVPTTKWSVTVFEAQVAGDTAGALVAAHPHVIGKFCVVDQRAAQGHKIHALIFDHPLHDFGSAKSPHDHYRQIGSVANAPRIVQEIRFVCLLLDVRSHVIALIAPHLNTATDFYSLHTEAG